MEAATISPTESVLHADKFSLHLQAPIPVDNPVVASTVNDVEDIAVDEGDCTLAGIKESSEFGVLGAPSSEHFEDYDALGKDFRCSLDTELIDDTTFISLYNVGMDPETAGKETEKKSLGNSVRFQCSEKGVKIVYSRIEVETLRYCNVEEQKKLWREVYNGFSIIARTEYDDLGSVRPQRKQSGFKGSNRGETLDGDLEIPVATDCTYDGDYNVEEEEDEDSDGSIQRPAFLVEGEPDFDSGPPEDGLEYLRRVRWEAVQIPKVKVAKLDISKVKKEQSVYMPQIPEIERCPEHVAPLKQWEEEFVCDFSELRLAISRLDGSHNNNVSNSRAVEATWSAGPILFTILKMDPVGRVSMLKRQISLFDSKDELSRNECLWLFALCAAIDTPLDADTSASLRALLRKCSKMRAMKSKLDDEAVMLNILVTISGNFFGQADNFLQY